MSATATEPNSTSAADVFEPRIVAFVCKWCTYAGADLAGTSRMTYPANTQAIMLPCTGRIDISFVIKAFLQGADGVLVSGCHPGDCHYTAGNFRARRRWTLLRDLLDTIGFDLHRLQFAWISAAEGAKWVKTVESFTHSIRELGPFTAMRQIASNHTPAAAAAPAADLEARSRNGAESSVAPAPAALIQSAAEALTSGEIKSVVGWVRNATLGLARPTWITTAEEAKGLVLSQGSGNLVRLLKNPAVRSLLPTGIVVRETESLAINVLLQEAQIKPTDVVLFAVNSDGSFVGRIQPNPETGDTFPDVDKLPVDRPTGFPESTLKTLDDLMARRPEERWAFWSSQFERCIKCYACRQSCPMCNCDQCFADKNQPQWFPTAADGAGNFAWHIVRAFHLAGRCIGCGACQNACPAEIPINLLSAAMARSALKNFGFRAGVSPSDPPLQAAYRPNDNEAFIL